MSKAQGQTTIKFISKSGTFSAYCTCSWGDLYQMYTSTANPNPVPNFSNISNTADKPLIEFHVNSSRLSDTITLSDPKIFIGNTLLKFDANSHMSTGTWSGVFELVTNITGIIGLRVHGNFAQLAGFASFVITFQAEISVNSQLTSENIQAFYNVSVLQGSESDVRVMITEVPTNGQKSLHGFTIRESGDVVTLKAVARQGNGVISSGLTYQWYSYDSSSSQWVAFSPAQTTETLEVSEAMVETYAAFMVAVTYDGKTLTDMQGVWDAQDALQMAFDADPVDFTIEEGNPNRQRVYLWPKVLNNGVQDMSYTKFRFAIHGSSGDVVNDPGAGSGVTQASDITDINTQVYTSNAVLDYSSLTKPANPTPGMHHPNVFYVNQHAMLQAGGDVSVTCETVV